MLRLKEAMVKGAQVAELKRISEQFFKVVPWKKPTPQIVTMDELEKVVDTLQIMKDMSSIKEGAGTRR